MNAITLQLSVAEINTVLEALRQLPYIKSSKLKAKSSRLTAKSYIVILNGACGMKNLRRSIKRGFSRFSADSEYGQNKVSKG